MPLWLMVRTHWDDNTTVPKAGCYVFAVSDGRGGGEATLKFTRRIKAITVENEVTPRVVPVAADGLSFGTTIATLGLSVFRVEFEQSATVLKTDDRTTQTDDGSSGAGGWSIALPGVAYGPPTVRGEVIYVGLESPAHDPPVAAMALRSSDGAQLWNYSLGLCRYKWVGGRCGALGGVAVSPDGRQGFIGADDFAVHAFDATNGTPRWNTSVLGHVAGRPAVSADGLLVYAATGRKPVGRGVVWALHTSTGGVAWKFPVPNGGGFYAAPTVHDGRIFIGTAGAGAMFCLNGTTGRLLWSFAPPTIPKGNASAGIPWNPLGCYNAGIYGTAAVVDGQVFFGAQDCAAWSVNATTGSVIWKAATVGVVSVSSPAVGNNSVFFGSDTFNTFIPYLRNSTLSAAVYAVDSGTGRELWRRNTSGNGIDSSAALTPSAVLIGSTTGGHQNASLLALDRLTGKLLHEFSTASLRASGLGNAIVFDVHAQRAVFGGCDCMLYSVDVEKRGGRMGRGFVESARPAKCGGCL